MNESQQHPPATPVVIPPRGGDGGGRHRLPAPPHALRGRAAVLAVAAGAAVSAASAGSVLDTTDTQSTEAGDIALLANGATAPATSEPAEPSRSGSTAATPSQPEPVLAASSEPATENLASAMLYTGTENNAEREIAEEEARRPQVVVPAVGAFTSGYGVRWGAMHSGIDIANSVGTPIVSATDGLVVDSGPAQGYGNWIRIKADDGTMFTYGHMQTLDVQAGEPVVAGEQIAGMGSLGFSTGSHLHFEVEVNGEKIDPLIWLAQNGLELLGADSLSGGSGATGSLGS